MRKNATSQAAPSLANFANIISDAKMLGRFWGELLDRPLLTFVCYQSLGILPIFQWMISMERSPPPTRTLLTIERLQGWSMLGFYPLEHLYYLRAHDLIPASIPSLAALFGRKSKRIPLDGNKLILWSCRCWLLYVVLQFAHLREDRKLLLTRQKNLRKGKGLSADDREDLRNRWDSLLNELVANAANLPLALHWFVFDNIWCTQTDSFSGLWRVVSSQTMYVELKSSTDFSYG